MSFYNEAVIKLQDLLKQMRGDVGSSGSMPVQLTGSNVALPVHLQYVTLADAEAVPTKVIGSSVAEVVVATGVTIPAGQAAAIGAVIDLQGAQRYAIGVITSANHTWSLSAQRLTNGAVALDGNSSKRDQVFPSAARITELSASFEVIAPKLRIYMTNGDAVDRTYDVYLYKLGTRVN
jgi:hypothetical protein